MGATWPRNSRARVLRIEKATSLSTCHGRLAEDRSRKEARTWNGTRLEWIYSVNEQLRIRLFAYGLLAKVVAGSLLLEPLSEGPSESTTMASSLVPNLVTSLVLVALGWL